MGVVVVVVGLVQYGAQIEIFALDPGVKDARVNLAHVTNRAGTVRVHSGPPVHGSMAVSYLSSCQRVVLARAGLLSSRPPAQPGRPHERNTTCRWALASRPPGRRKGCCCSGAQRGARCVGYSLLTVRCRLWRQVWNATSVGVAVSVRECECVSKWK